jgi:hypothetical protein
MSRVGAIDSETDAPAGVVLGFALIKRLVDEHGGSLQVGRESGEKDDVVAITIRLPLGSGHLPEGSLKHGDKLTAYELHHWDDSEDGTLDAPSVGLHVYGVDRSTLSFDPTDVILLVDGGCGFGCSC